MATQLWQVRIGRIIDTLEELSATDIRCIAASLRDQSMGAAHELAWWNETMIVDRELRLSRQSRAAALAVQRAIAALEVVAARTGLASNDNDVRCLAQVLRSITRAAVVGMADPIGAHVLGLRDTAPTPAYLPEPSILPQWAARRSA